MADNPSSDDLIRQAREALAFSGSDPRVSVEHPVEDVHSAMERHTVADQTLEERKRTWVEDVPSRPAPSPRYASQGTVAPIPDSRSGGSKAWRVIGIVILIAVIVFWVLLVLGLGADPTDAGSALGGGVALTVIPVGIGIYSLRRGTRR